MVGDTVARELMSVTCGMVCAAGQGEDLERNLQALVTDSTLRQAEPVTAHSA